MKKVVLMSTVVILGMTACKKEKVAEVAAVSPTQVPEWLAAEAGGLCIHYGYELLQNSQGDYACLVGKLENCAKIGPCPATPGNKRDNDRKQLIREFIHAFDLNNVSSFFDIPGWQELFPGVASDHALLGKIKSGEMIFQRSQSSAGSTVFQLVTSGSGKQQLSQTVAIEIEG
ncbi:MAG: hypothetical protein KDD36_01150 [Flavobacteriales bacterium]|nr:hypothetical protein [Flavobacteriales bacterium]